MDNLTPVHSGPGSPSDEEDLETLASIVRSACITEAAAVDVRSAVGRPLSWFIDIKAALLHPQFLRGVAREFLRSFGARDDVQIACFDGFGTALLGAILALSPGERRFRGLVIRREPKPTGLGKLVEGDPDGRPCIIVDDIINSGGSAERIVSILSEHGTPVEAVFAVLSHGNPALDRRAEYLGFRVQALFTTQQFGFGSRPPPPEPRPSSWFVKWSRKPGRDIGCATRPVRQMRTSRHRLLYARRAGGIFCLSTEDGSVHWKRAGHIFEPMAAGSPLTVLDEQVLVGGIAGETDLVDIETGTSVWRARFGDVPCNAVCVAAGRSTCIQAFRSLGDGQAVIVDYDLRTGKLRNNVATDFVPSSDFIDLPDGHLLVASEAGELIKISTDLDIELRRPAASNEPYSLVRTGRSDVALLAIGRSGRICSVDTSNLEMTTIGHATGVVTSVERVSTSIIDVASSRNWFYRLSFDDSALKIKRSPTFFMGRVISNTCNVNGRAFVADTAGWIYEVNEDLNIISQKNFGQGIEQMETKDNKIMLLHQDGSLRCVSI